MIMKLYVFKIFKDNMKLNLKIKSIKIFKEKLKYLKIIIIMLKIY